MTLFVCGRFYFGTYVFSAKLLGGSPSKHRSFFAVCKHVCPFSSAVWLILSTTWIFSFAFLSPWLSAHLYLFVIMNRIQNTGSINNQIKKITCINADCFWKVYKLKSKINKNRPCFEVIIHEITLYWYISLLRYQNCARHCLEENHDRL